MNLPCKKYAFKVQKRQLFPNIFKKIDNLLQYLSVMNPFNPFYHKGFRNYSYKSLVGHPNCRKKPLELHLILRYSI